MATCEICGHEFVSSCMRCSRRIETWGEIGTLKLIELSKSTKSINGEEIMQFITTYYSGRAKTASDKANVFRTALRALGYTGKFIGRIHRNGASYLQLRRREHATGRRYRLKKDRCELCQSKTDTTLHHIVPLSWGGKTSEENCITLCRSCHLKVHKKLSRQLGREKLLEYLKPYAEEIKIISKSSLPI